MIRIRELGLIFVVLSMQMACESPTENSQTALAIIDFKIARGELSNSGIDTGRIYVGDELYAAIDGYAPTYLDMGMNKALYQRIDTGAIIIQAAVMDFKSESNSAAMYESQIADYSQGSVVAGTHIEKVYKANGRFGIDIYGYYKNIYIEIIIEDGGSSTSADREALADELIALYDEKVKNSAQ